MRNPAPKTLPLSLAPSLLLALLLTPLVACFSPTEQFCESDEECSEDQICNLDSQVCISAPSSAERPDASTTPADDLEEGACAERCVQAAPEGWQGPMARSDADAGEVPSSCGGAFDTDLGLASSEILLDGSCSCSCGDAQSLGCTNAFLFEWESSLNACELNLCDILGSDCVQTHLSIFTDSCQLIPSNMRNTSVLKATMGNLRGGSCGQAQASGELSSHFGKQDRLCEVSQETASCGEDAVCAPASPEGFSDGLCILQVGEASCPEGSPYSERTLIYDGIDDQRSCTAESCSCDAPRGSCGGRVELYNGGGDDDTCSTPLATLTGGTGIFGNSNYCQARPANATTVTYLVDLDNRSCDSGGEAGTSGESVGTGVRTLCCMP